MGSQNGGGKPEIPPEMVQAIYDLHDAGVGRNEIARRLDISASTVTKWCDLSGRKFDRTATKEATAARKADAAALRAEAALREQQILAHQQRELLDVFEGRKKHRIWVRNEGGGEVEREVDYLPSADLRNLAQSRNNSVVIGNNLLRSLSEESTADDRQMLADIAKALGRARDEPDAPGADEGDGLDPEAGRDDPEG